MSSAAEKLHLRRVCALGCIVCGSPAIPHHIKSVAAGSGTGHKVSDYLAIPLCNTHHQGAGYGISYHDGPEEWECRYGSQEEHLATVYNELGLTTESIDGQKTKN